MSNRENLANKHASLASSASYHAISSARGLRADRALPLPHYTGSTSRYKAVEAKIKIPERTVTVASGQDLILMFGPAVGGLSYGVETSGTLTVDTDRDGMITTAASWGNYSLPTHNPLESFITSEMGTLGNINSIAGTSTGDEPPFTQLAQGKMRVQVAVPYDGLAQTAVLTADNAPQFAGEETYTYFPPMSTGYFNDPNLLPEIHVPRIFDDGVSRTPFAIAQGAGESFLQVGSSSAAVQNYTIRSRSERGWWRAGILNAITGPPGTINAHNQGFRGSIAQSLTYGFAVIRNLSGAGVNISVTFGGELGMHIILPELSHELTSVSSKAFIRQMTQQSDYLYPNQRDSKVSAGAAKLKIDKNQTGQSSQLDQSSLHPHKHTDYVQSAMSTAYEWGSKLGGAAKTVGKFVEGLGASSKPPASRTTSRITDDDVVTMPAGVPFGTSTADGGTSTSFMDRFTSVVETASKVAPLVESVLSMF